MVTIKKMPGLNETDCYYCTCELIATTTGKFYVRNFSLGSNNTWSSSNWIEK